jgi:single-strand DNA-binding protein
MNNVNMIGRLALDTRQGNNVATNLLAVKRIYKGKDGEEDSDFIQVTAWGRQADVLAKYCKKGDKIGISGRIKTSTYTDKQGQQQHGFEVTVEHIYLLNNSQSYSQSRSDNSALTDQDVNRLAQRLSQASKAAEVQVSDDDLPF